MIPIMNTDMNLLAKYPMVEALILDMRSSDNGLTTTGSAIHDIKEVFDREGPFEYAQRFGLLKNGSGEEFAMQFMAFFNAYSSSNTY